MHELQVRVTVPVLGHPMVRWPEIQFTGWFPFDDCDAIETVCQGLAVRVWFDITSTWIGPFRHDMPELIERTENLKDVRAYSMFVDVGVSGQRDELVRYIQHRSQSWTSPADEEQDLQREYESLGRDVYVAAVSTVNRLIAYIRAKKGQYWLHEYPTNVCEAAPYFAQFKAAARVNEGDWFPWRFFTDWTGTGLPLDSSRQVDKETWLAAKEFINSNRRTPLIGELLAGAELLAAMGHSRTALTEAVTALEVAISSFARRPQVQSAFDPILTARMGVESLYNQITRLGLTSTVYYLLPVIFTEEQMPTALLKTCQDAIAQRQNVVHQGQRDVDPNALMTFLKAIRGICAILEGYGEDYSMA